MELVHGSYFVFSSIFVSSVSFFPILVLPKQHHHSDHSDQPRLLRRSRCRSRSRKRAPGSFVIVSPRRKLHFAGSENSTWVPFLVFQFLLTDPEADHVFQGFFSIKENGRWSMMWTHLFTGDSGNSKARWRNDFWFRVGSEDSTIQDVNMDSANHAWQSQSCRIQVPAQFGGLVLGCELWTVDFVKDGDEIGPMTDILLKNVPSLKPT